EALGEKLKKTRKEQDMLRLIITRFQQQLVEMLFIDEAHHLVERSGGTGKLLQHNARVLKQLLNKSGAGVVLVGIPLARNVLGIDDDQNGRRTEYEFRLGRLDWNDKDEQDYYRGILAALEDLASFPKESMLWGDEKAYRI